MADCGNDVLVRRFGRRHLDNAMPRTSLSTAELRAKFGPQPTGQYRHWHAATYTRQDLLDTFISGRLLKLSPGQRMNVSVTSATNSVRPEGMLKGQSYVPLCRHSAVDGFGHKFRRQTTRAMTNVVLGVVIGFPLSI